MSKDDVKHHKEEITNINLFMCAQTLQDDLVRRLKVLANTAVQHMMANSKLVTQGMIAQGSSGWWTRICGGASEPDHRPRPDRLGRSVPVVAS